MPSNIGLGNLIETKHELLSHNFDLFSSPAVEKAMCRGYEQEIHLNTALTDDGPYDFLIPPGTDYIFLPQTRLHVKCKIVNQNGADLAAHDAAAAPGPDFAICNLFPHALFQHVEVEIAGIKTSANNSLYPYKAFFETLFSYSNDAKSSHLKACSGWEPDTSGKHDTRDEENTGYITRRAKCRASRSFDFCLPLHADMLQCVKLLPPHTSMAIRLLRKPDNFSLIANNDTQLKIKIESMTLFIRKIVPTEHIRSSFLTNLSKKLVILPFTRSLIKNFSITRGMTNEHINLFKGELPRQILITFIESTRIDGRKNLNPFKFSHFDVKYINLRIDGMSDPGKPYEPDFGNELVSREIRALYDNTGITTSDTGYSISSEDFRNGSTFFAWDLSPDKCNGFHNHEKKEGRTVDIDLAFANALPENITVLVYASFETDIKLLDGQVVEASLPLL